MLVQIYCTSTSYTMAPWDARREKPGFVQGTVIVKSTLNITN
jgi:hypothetical protein